MKFILFLLVVIVLSFLVYVGLVVPNRILITRSIDNFSDPNKDHIYTDYDVLLMHQNSSLCYSNSDCQQSCFDNALCQDNGVTYNCHAIDPGTHNKFNPQTVEFQDICTTPAKNGYGICVNNKCELKSF